MSAASAVHFVEMAERWRTATWPHVAPVHFKVKGEKPGAGGGESNAEGYYMSFEYPNRHFVVQVALPSAAKPGGKFINFYMSFYTSTNLGVPSLAEIGVSLSQGKQWNFFINCLRSPKGCKNPEESPHLSALEGRTIQIAVLFEKQPPIVPPSPKKDHRTVKAAEGIDYVIANLRIGGLPFKSLKHPLLHHDTVKLVHMVAAAGDRRDAMWNNMSMTFLGDTKKRPHEFAMNWVSGSEVLRVNGSDRHMECTDIKPNCFSCILHPK
jgi:hypothetical protein